MALSDYERQMLEELEAQLADEDPSFAKTMKPESVSPSGKRQISLRHIVLGMIIAVLGIALLVFSIALPFIPLGVFGVLVMGFGFWYASSSKKSETVPPVEVSGEKPLKSQSSRSEEHTSELQSR